MPNCTNMHQLAIHLAMTWSSRNFSFNEFKAQFLLQWCLNLSVFVESRSTVQLHETRPQSYDKHFAFTLTKMYLCKQDVQSSNTSPRESKSESGCRTSNILSCWIWLTIDLKKIRNLFFVKVLFQSVFSSGTGLVFFWINLSTLNLLEILRPQNATFFEICD